MELLNKILVLTAIITEPEIEEDMLVFVDKSTRKEHLSQPLQTKHIQYEIAITFSTGYNGKFNITSSSNNFHSAKSITNKDCFIQTTDLPGAYEFERWNIEIKRIIFDEGHFNETDYLITIKPFFSTLDSIIENSREEPFIFLVVYPMIVYEIF